MGLVTANIKVKGVPLRRAFVEHTDPSGLTSLGWAMTDGNGSFTFDAGFGFDAVDIKIHCQNSVIRVLNAPLLSVPIDIHVSVANGKTLKIENSGHQDVLDHFRLLAKCQDVSGRSISTSRGASDSARRSASCSIARRRTSTSSTRTSRAEATTRGSPR
jgi:hypothetical protein